jgi:hypothetical protein
MFYDKKKRFNERDAMTARESGQGSLADSIHIGLLSNKYQCSKVEQWALKLISTKINIPLFCPAKQTLEYLVRTCWKCHWNGPLKTTSVQLLLESYLPLQPIPFSPFNLWNNGGGEPQSGAHLSALLRLAESIGSVELKAKAYYKFLCSMNWRLSPKIRQNSQIKLGKLAAQSEDGAQSWWEPLDNLTDEQKICLYRGFHALNALRDELQNVPAVEVLPVHKCGRLKALKEKWRTVAKELSIVRQGPTEFILKMKEQLDWSTCDSEKCHVRLLLTRIEDFLKGFDDILIEIFGH